MLCSPFLFLRIYKLHLKFTHFSRICASKHLTKFNFYIIILNS